MTGTNNGEQRQWGPGGGGGGVGWALVVGEKAKEGRELGLRSGGCKEPEERKRPRGLVAERVPESCQASQAHSLDP